MNRKRHVDGNGFFGELPPPVTEESVRLARESLE